MRVARWLIIALAALVAGWMVFDGTRALVVGDYVTPSSGRYAGRLGPWAGLVTAIGVDPRGTFMKLFFVAYGLTWLLVIVGFARGRAWSWPAMVAAAAGSLWYLVIGTASSLAQLVLLMLVRARASHPARPRRSSIATT